jgi:hypothetical protein
MQWPFVVRRLYSADWRKASSIFAMSRLDIVADPTLILQFRFWWTIRISCTSPRWRRIYRIIVSFNCLILSHGARPAAIEDCAVGRVTTSVPHLVRVGLADASSISIHQFLASLPNNAVDRRVLHIAERLQMRCYRQSRCWQESSAVKTAAVEQTVDGSNTDAYGQARHCGGLTTFIARLSTVPAPSSPQLTLESCPQFSMTLLIIAVPHVAVTSEWFSRSPATGSSWHVHHRRRLYVAPAKISG